jgi:hypothetical protein
MLIRHRCRKNKVLADRWYRGNIPSVRNVQIEHTRNKMSIKMAVIGKGNVGNALGRGLERAGHEVRTVGNNPASVRDTAAWGEVIMLAVPFPAIDDTIGELGDSVRGKVMVDVTNALTPDYQLPLNIQLGYMLKMGTQIGFKLVH